MSNIKKEILVICLGYKASKEMYDPGCDVTRLIRALWRGKKSHFVFEDMVTFKNFGWEIRYKGVESERMKLVKAIYEGELEY